MHSFHPRLFAEHIEADPSVGLSDEWYTPRHVIEAARLVLGGIDLDPASCVTAQQVVQADTYYTKEQDGLSLPWFGRVWLNPPYSRRLIRPFTAMLHDAYQRGVIEAAVMITNTATDTPWAQTFISNYPVCFFRGRIDFWTPVSHAGHNNRYTQQVFYLGPNIDRFTDVFSAFGVVKR